MNSDLKSFLVPIARTVAATLFVVFTVAFLTVPYALEQHPGDPQLSAAQTVPRHMT
ncbi:hypothetical protein [Acidovorax sp.]|uniref:hypothetical protein n=1 Tax=unclassified Acidovorax TaxID=2684926 RepID=UPI0025C38F38|nr:hypothetical protein [Acidovorax sp.]MCE1191621.1 hypothetical protein [Acidovorax sp.]